jgi:hypothetical protein
MESIQIYLNSLNADIIQNINTDATFYLPNLNISNQHEIYISVQSCSIPYSFYQINTTNNFIKYTINGFQDIYDLYIPVGNYNINELITFLNSNMSGFTTTYNVKQNNITITNNNNYNWQFMSASTALILGFNYPSYSTNYSITSNNINLNPISYINILTNYKTKSFIKKIGVNNPDFNLLCSFPIEINRNGIIIYKNINNLKINTYTNNLNQLQIKITDNYGNLINLNGSNWDLIIQFDIIKFTG